jgi:hypothetical protein
MADESPLHKCPRCLQERPSGEYINPADKKRRYICNTCFKEKAMFQARERWDWASALKKSTKMHVSKTHGREGIYYDSLDEDIIRALMAAQDGKCAITDEPFYLPTPEQLGKNVTLSKWQQTLEPHHRRRVPVMVRASIEGNWVPGNVLLIMDGIREYYEYCGGLIGLHPQSEAILKHTPVIPQNEQLLQLRAKLIDEELKKLQ